MTIQPLTGILIAGVLVLTVLTMLMWHRLTGGAWRNYSAGKALMSLLGVQTCILSLATVTTWFGDWPGKPWFYIIVYTLLIGAMLQVAYTILDTHRKAQKIDH